jgi:hypothetical protein
MLHVTVPVPFSADRSQLAGREPIAVPFETGRGPGPCPSGVEDAKRRLVEFYGDASSCRALILPTAFRPEWTPTQSLSVIHNCALTLVQ